MDANVIAALARWPDVPDVYGWLSLDARGRWLVRGEHVINAALNAFIGRNYAHDDRGAWYFQNGPQRVFVSLACTPWIIHLDANGQAETHTGLPVLTPTQAWITGKGSMLLNTEYGMGLLNDRDLASALERVHDACGQQVDEDTLLELMGGQPRPLQLQLGASLIPLAPIAEDQISVIGNFISEPAPIT
jgi:hypothetical protein